MTGMFAERTGTQHTVFQMPDRAALPDNLNLMPHYFKKYGYDTHLGLLIYFCFL